ncbi:hypothetical protein D3C72_2297020 [compost metagenome]
MAKMAPLSLAEETFWPVFTRFCVIDRSRLVLFRFCRAIRAPALVLMLLAILAFPHFVFDISDAVLAVGSILLGGSLIRSEAADPPLIF